jgi:hypothetical protein
VLIVEHEATVGWTEARSRARQSRARVRQPRDTSRAADYQLGMTLETLVTRLLPRPEAGRLLSASERRTLAAASEVLLADARFPLSPDDLTRNVERFIGGSRRAWRVRMLLTFVEHAPRFAGRSRFSRSSHAERAGLLRDGLHPRLAFVTSLFRRVRPLVILGAYATPAARRRVGFIEVADRARFHLRVAS